MIVKCRRIVYDGLVSKPARISFVQRRGNVAWIREFDHEINKQHKFYEISWAISLQQEFYQEIESAIANFQKFRQFIDRHDVIAADDSNQQFQHAIYREFMRRQRASRRSINKKIAFKPIFIMMDDVVHRITVGATKKSTREFLAWYTGGFSVNMYGNFISPSSVRYLLEQIFSRIKSIIPTVKSNEISFTNSLRQALGVELILPGEGLVFYRELNQANFIKFFTASNGNI